MLPSSNLANFNIDLTQPANVQALTFQAAYTLNALTPIPGLPNPTIQPAQTHLLATLLNFYGQHTPNLTGLPAHLGNGVLPTPPNAMQGLPLAFTGIMGAVQPPTNTFLGGMPPVNVVTVGMNENLQNLQAQFAIDQAAINRAAQQILNNGPTIQRMNTAQQIPVQTPQNVAVPNQNVNENWHPSPPSSEDEAQRTVVGVTIKKEVDCVGQGNVSDQTPQIWSSSDIKTELQKVEVKFKPKAHPKVIELCSLGPNRCSAPFYKYSRPLKLTHCTKCWSPLHTFCFNNTNRATNEKVTCCDGRMNYRAGEFFETHRDNFFQGKKKRL